MGAMLFAIVVGVSSLVIVFVVVLGAFAEERRTGGVR
jgi:hypothetical protein